MSSAALLPAQNSAAFLPRDAAVVRKPRWSLRGRPAAFFDAFEDRALFYDCFRHEDGTRVLLVGPPPMNLRRQYEAAVFTADAGGRQVLRARFHRSASVMITELADVPEAAEHITVAIAGTSFELPIQPNSSAALAGRRVLFTMSKDNEPGWVREWASWHARLHGTDSIVVFDNGSTTHPPGEIEEALRGVAGIAAVAVQSWPYRYGPLDRAVFNNPYYTLFPQIAAMSVALRRYAGRAFGLLNCDIDELVETGDRGSIYELAAEAPQGLVVMRGQYVEAKPSTDAPATRAHRDFPYRLKDETPRVSRPRKWALDPRRAWVRSLDVHPYMHWIEGRPRGGKSSPDGVFYWHFRGINTRWKDDRIDHQHLTSELIEPDVALARRWDQLVSDAG